MTTTTTSERLCKLPVVKSARANRAARKRAFGQQNHLSLIAHPSALGQISAHKPADLDSAMLQAGQQAFLQSLITWCILSITGAC